MCLCYLARSFLLRPSHGRFGAQQPNEKWPNSALRKLSEFILTKRREGAHTRRKKNEDKIKSGANEKAILRWTKKKMCGNYYRLEIIVQHSLGASTIISVLIRQHLLLIVRTGKTK